MISIFKTFLKTPVKVQILIILDSELNLGGNTLAPSGGQTPRWGLVGFLTLTNIYIKLHYSQFSALNELFRG